MDKEIYGGNYYGNQYVQNQPTGNNGNSGKKSDKTWLVILLSIFSVVLIALIVFLLIRASKKLAEKNTPQGAYRDILTDLREDPEEFFSKIDGLENYDISEVDISEDEFSITDTDGDSIPELIVNITSAGEDDSFALVYDYNEDDGAQIRGIMDADPEFYSDGTVVTKSEEDDIEITLIEEYDDEQQEYAPLIRYYESNESDVYVIEHYENDDWNDAETVTYDELMQDIEKIIGDLEKLIIDFLKITEENIEKIIADDSNDAKEETAEKENTGYKTGDIIEFGSYPQSKVTDSGLIKNLNSLAGDNANWTSYGYYSGTGDYYDGQMKASDYMRYKDVTYNGTKYRGVAFDSYRSWCTGDISSGDYFCQDDNGYSTDTTYWFKYEPIKWKVLDPSTGLVMCTTAIDSQAYNNYILYDSDTDEYYGDLSGTYYASDYANSSIRKWLNDDFYNTAFSSSQQNIIKTSTLDNSSPYDSNYDSATTTDKIYLLSYYDSINSNYGFDSDEEEYDTARQLKSSDYAKCQGCLSRTDSDYIGNCNWWLRSPCVSRNACRVGLDGFNYCSDYVCVTDEGVVPALNLNLSSLETLSETTTKSKETTEETTESKRDKTIDILCKGCWCTHDYMSGDCYKFIFHDDGTYDIYWVYEDPDSSIGASESSSSTDTYTIDSDGTVHMSGLSDDFSNATYSSKEDGLISDWVMAYAADEPYGYNRYILYHYPDTTDARKIAANWDGDKDMIYDTKDLDE